jgi:hypothetical protein
MPGTWGCKIDPELAALIERSRGHVMTPEERREQRISFVFGMLPYRSTTTKADVRRMLQEMGQ